MSSPGLTSPADLVLLLSRKHIWKRSQGSGRNSPLRGNLSHINSVIGTLLDLKRPLALLRAVHSVGRLSELDWICAARAYEAAVGARLHPSMSVFLNMEP